MLPHLICRNKIPEKLPKEMDFIVKRLKKAKNKEECLKKAYDILSKKYRGYKWRTYTRIHELFMRDVNKIWAKKVFLHCTNINYLLRILLIKSGFFKEGDIKLKWTTLYLLSPHQYVIVRINKKKYINIDIWAKPYGIKLGDHAHGTHT